MTFRSPERLKHHACARHIFRQHFHINRACRFYPKDKSNLFFSFFFLGPSANTGQFHSCNSSSGNDTILIRRPIKSQSVIASVRVRMASRGFAPEPDPKKTSNNRRKTGRNPEQDREGSKREGKSDFHKAPVVVLEDNFTACSKAVMIISSSFRT